MPAQDLEEEIRQRVIGSEWVASDVLTEAWRRRIRIPDLPDFLRRCTTAVRLRCACVDAVEDVRVSISHELVEDFGLEAEAVALVPTRSGKAPVPEALLAKVVGSRPPKGAVYSRAAALRSGDPEAERLVPTVPVLSPESVEDIAHWIVRLNLEKGAG